MGSMGRRTVRCMEPAVGEKAGESWWGAKPEAPGCLYCGDGREWEGIRG